MKNLDILSAVLLVIGGLNWGLYGLFNFDLVAAIGGGGFLSTLIYGLVFLSAIYQATSLRGIQKRWNVSAA